MISLEMRAQVERALRFFLCTTAFLVFLKPTVNHTLLFFGFNASFEDETCYGFMLMLAVAVMILFGMKRKLDIFCVSVLVFCAFVAVSTVYNCGDLLVVVVDWLPCVATVMIVGLFAREEPRSVLLSFFLACSFYLVCNLVYLLQNTALITVGGVDNLVFGYRNVTFRVAIPAFVCALVLDDMDGKTWSLRSLTVLCLGFFELIVGYSATSICAFLIMSLLAMMTRVRRRQSFLNALTYVVSFGVLFLGLVILRVQNALGFLIEPLLHRSVTFTGRTVIWDDAFAHLCSQHFFTGYGTGYIWNALSWNGAVQKHAHNEVLHALMLGGIGALASFVVTAGLSVARLYHHRKSSIAASLSVGLAAFLVVSLAEVSTCPGFYFILAFSFYFFSKDVPPEDSKVRDEVEKVGRL